MFGNSTGRSDDVDNIRRVATTYKVSSNLCMAMHVDPWLNKGTCPSYFLKWTPCVLPHPTFSSLRPNRCVPFHAVIMICDFRVKLSTNVYVYVCSFRGRSRKRGRSPHGRAVIIVSINKRLLMRRQTNISTRSIL